MKIGLIGYASRTGLGYQTGDFAKVMKPSKILICDLSKFNNMPLDDERFSEFKTRTSKGFPTNRDCEWLVDDMDVVFYAENPLNYYLLEYAKKKGVKTVAQFNPEFLEYHRRPRLNKPDVLASPSYWLMDEVKAKVGDTKVMYWPVPIETRKIPFREMKKVRTLVHIIGRPAAEDRNGTVAFLMMAKYYGMKYHYKIYIQPPTDVRAMKHFKPVKRLMEMIKGELKDNLEIIENIEDNTQMYASGEILILPRKYGGLCLPMWEGLSAGMPVIMTNTSPNDKVLPKEWLCECKPKGSFMARISVELFEAKYESLIKVVNHVVGNIEAYNKVARQMAEDMDWKKQKNIYLKRFRKLCKS